MKAINITIVFVLCLFLGCNKEEMLPNPGTSAAPITYTSMKDFYTKNGVITEIFSIQAANGGTFVSIRGTTVNIPANAFKDTNSVLISGPLNFEFRDIYKRSEMVLSGMPTNCSTGAMKSVGEFYLNVNYSNGYVVSTKSIQVIQPSSLPYDNNMYPVTIIRPDTAKFVVWDMLCGSFSCATSLTYQAPDYHYYIKAGYFSSSPSSLHWFNTDNPDVFSAFPQTTLTVKNPDNTMNPDVFLIFKSENSVVQIFNSNGYIYNYAPIGLQATVVAAGLKNGVLRASFIPITITANQTVTLNFQTMSPSLFASNLKALD